MRPIPMAMFLFLVTYGLSVVSLAEDGIADEVTSSAERSDLISKVEQAIVAQTNEFRVENDLDPVQVDEELQKTAERFASYMAKTDRYGHHADGKTPAERATEAGYDYCVVRENIAYRTNTGEVTQPSLTEVFVQGWIDSPPHRENMLADYATQTGVGVATSDDVTYYAVQLFGRPRSKSIRLTVRNESDTMKTLIVEANDSRDELEMPPRTVVKMTRCFPTKLSLLGVESGEGVRIRESTTYLIQGDELRRADAS